MEPSREGLNKATSQVPDVTSDDESLGASMRWLLLLALIGFLVLPIIALVMVSVGVFS
jgi:hypothetical protein